MIDDFEMYGSDSDEEQPKQLGPMAMLARKVDRLEIELRDARDEIVALRRLLDGNMRGIGQLRNKISVAETQLGNLRKTR